VEGTAFYVVYPVVSLKMADDLPGVSAFYQFTQQCVVQTVTRFITDKMTDNRHPQEEEVTDGVEDFVLHEFVGKAQPLLIDDFSSSRTTALLSEPPNANPFAWRYSTSLRNPKVLAAQISSS